MIRDFEHDLTSILLCHVMSVMSCHVSYVSHVMSCHVMSRHVTSCHVMSCHVMSCHVMLHYKLKSAKWPTQPELIPVSAA